MKIEFNDLVRNSKSTLHIGLDDKRDLVVSIEHEDHTQYAVIIDWLEFALGFHTLISLRNLAAEMGVDEK